MAYDASKEKQEVIAQIKKNDRGEYIRVTRVTPVKGNNLSVDIRLMYTNANDEIAPTTKGLRLNDENVVEVMMGMLEAMGPAEFTQLMEEIDDKYGNDTESDEDDEDDEDDCEEDSDEDGEEGSEEE